MTGEFMPPSYLGDTFARMLQPLSFGFQKRTPEEIEAAKAAAQTKKDAAEQSAHQIHGDLMTAAPELLKPLIELHGPHFGSYAYDYEPHCDGCDAYGQEVDDTAWPCTTYELLLRLASPDTPKPAE